MTRDEKKTSGVSMIAGATTIKSDTLFQFNLFMIKEAIGDTGFNC
jgi:hypothetical protein